MADFAHETDVSKLQQLVQLQQAELQKLYERLGALTAELAKLKGTKQAEQLELELKLLKEQLDARTRALFGPRSEKRRRRGRPPKKQTPQTGHGPTAQPELRVVEQVHDRPDDERECPATGCDGTLTESGLAEESEEVHIIRREYVIRRHVRPKYRCPKCSYLEAMEGPPRLIPGGRYSEDFAVQVACDKYADHIPLDRQRRMMKDRGLVVSTATLCDQVRAVARLCEPTYEALRLRALESDAVGLDESRWKLLVAPKDDAKKSRRRPRSTKYWMWSLVGDDAVYVHIDPKRSGSVAEEMLGDYDGVIMVDGFPGYESLVRRRRSAGSPLRIAFCWAHVRRKFIEAEANYPEAAEALDLIDELYAIEEQARSQAALSGGETPEAHREALFDARRTLRRDSRGIVERFVEWMAGVSCLPRSALGGAIAYAHKRIAGLRVFLDEPGVPLDNNHTERALRGPVVGRKVHYGSRSEAGLHVAEVLYSIIESARRVGISPALYLRALVRRALQAPMPDEFVLLPGDLARELSQPASGPLAIK